MGSKPDKTQFEPEIFFDKSGNMEQQMLIYTLLRIFHVFINVISNNYGDVGLVISILRDFRKNFDGFYNKLLVFFDIFCKELQKIDELKLTTEHSKSETRFVVKIELNYSVLQKETTIPALSENQLQVAKTDKTINGELGYSPRAKPPTAQTFQLNLENRLPVTTLMQSIAQNMQIPLNLPFLKFFHNVNRDKIQPIETPDTPKAIEEAPPESEPDFDLKIADLELSPVEAEPTSTYLNDMLKDLSLKPPAEDTAGDEDYSVEEEMKDEYQKIVDSVPVVDIPVETFGVGASTPVTKPFIPEDDSPEEQELNDEFQAKLEQQRQEFRLKMEALKEERRQKRKAHDAEMKDLRRQQKQRFATIMQCIFLKQRFEEKESDWSSWIENSLRKLIAKIVGKFGDFQDFTKNFSNFKKLCKEDPEDVISEIGDLNRAILTVLYDLEIVFNKLAKGNQDFEGVMFIRVIQKRICKVAVNLTELLHLLEENEYTASWYQSLEQKMSEIQPSQIPTTTELKKICKNLNKEEFENLEFPRWENNSQVIIEEVDEEDDKPYVSNPSNDRNDEENPETDHVEINDSPSMNHCEDQLQMSTSIAPVKSDGEEEDTIVYSDHRNEKTDSTSQEECIEEILASNSERSDADQENCEASENASNENSIDNRGNNIESVEEVDDKLSEPTAEGETNDQDNSEANHAEIDESFSMNHCEDHQNAHIDREVEQKVNETSHTRIPVNETATTHWHQFEQNGQYRNESAGKQDTSETSPESIEEDRAENSKVGAQNIQNNGNFGNALRILKEETEAKTKLFFYPEASDQAISLVVADSLPNKLLNCDGTSCSNKTCSFENGQVSSDSTEVSSSSTREKPGKPTEYPADYEDRPVSPGLPSLKDEKPATDNATTSTSDTSTSSGEERSNVHDNIASRTRSASTREWRNLDREQNLANPTSKKRALTANGERKSPSPEIKRKPNENNEGFRDNPNRKAEKEQRSQVADLQPVWSSTSGLRHRSNF